MYRDVEIVIYEIGWINILFYYFFSTNIINRSLFQIKIIKIKKTVNIFEKK